MIALLFLAACFLAFTNGANDNFKGVASLYGSGTTSFRAALGWGTATGDERHRSRNPARRQHRAGRSRQAVAALPSRRRARSAVESPRGAIGGTAELWEGIREDTIFVPNSFGPAQAMGDEFGLPRYETANTLLDDRYFDNLSGQQAYKCFACRVRKA